MPNAVFNMIQIVGISYLFYTNRVVFFKSRVNFSNLNLEREADQCSRIALYYQSKRIKISNSRCCKHHFQEGLWGIKVEEKLLQSDLSQGKQRSVIKLWD